MVDMRSTLFISYFFRSREAGCFGGGFSEGILGGVKWGLIDCLTGK